MKNEVVEGGMVWEREKERYKERERERERESERGNVRYLPERACALKSTLRLKFNCFPLSFSYLTFTSDGDN